MLAILGEQKRFDLRKERSEFAAGITIQKTREAHGKEPGNIASAFLDIPPGIELNHNRLHGFHGFLLRLHRINRNNTKIQRRKQVGLI